MFEVFGECLNTVNGVQGTVNTKHWFSVFGEKEGPYLKQRSLFIGGVQRLPEHSERCSKNLKHQVWVFGVRGKRETHFGTEVTLCSRCLVIDFWLVLCWFAVGWWLNHSQIAASLQFVCSFYAAGLLLGSFILTMAVLGYVIELFTDIGCSPMKYLPNFQLQILYPLVTTTNGCKVWSPR